jgi:Domain of unknown function (DUF4129)
MNARRLLPIGLAVTALVLVVALAANGRPLSRARGGAGPSAAFFDYVATTVFLFFVVAFLVFVAIVLTGERTGGGPPRRVRRSLWSSLAMFIGALALAYLISSSEFQQRLRDLQARQSQQAEQVRPPAADDKRNGIRDARLRWDEVTLVLLLVGGVATYIYLTRRRRRELRPLFRRRQDVADALDESLDDLRDDPDVRRAIIAAYARMERALARSGIPRRPAEAPFEYLERALLELDTGADAASALTGLFERAKFSHHEPDESMRNEAIDALVAVRDDLRSPAPEPVLT